MGRRCTRSIPENTKNPFLRAARGLFGENFRQGGPGADRFGSAADDFANGKLRKHLASGGELVDRFSTPGAARDVACHASPQCPIFSGNTRHLAGSLAGKARPLADSGQRSVRIAFVMDARSGG